MPFIVCLLGILLISAGCTSNETVILPEDIPNYVQESDFEKIDWERNAQEFGDRGVIGNENKSGVIGADLPSVDRQKWMWHLWGVKNPETVDLTIVGFNKETETVHQILVNGWTGEIAGANNGADAHMPSNVEVPKTGEWAMLLYADGDLFDILFYDISE
ncbi:hypothetical protein [Alteribacillus sp. YIM 98480]|uniref:hypothetical protein n=1 Tax=Alteribacillus sp. YIM 98480 TaxID=2606599 RepID=UPI00131ABF91|nr:hypothetical protein [Alteribacillus sp. YIM 98480]